MDWDNVSSVAFVTNFTPTKNGLLIANGKTTNTNGIIAITMPNKPFGNHYIAMACYPNTNVEIGCSALVNKGQTYYISYYAVNGTGYFIPFK